MAVNEQPNVWPPAPAASSAAPQAAPVAACPTCGRKLLTQTSALCNWCGAKIDNPEYQARAAQTRQERDQQERAELEALIQEEAAHGILGRLKRLGKQNKLAPRRDPLV
jgi:predicted amidophosphoribosyltransferase